MYITVILYNLNLLLNTYVEIMIKMITMFNYKNTGVYKKNFFFFDIFEYKILKKNIFFNFFLILR